MPNVATPPFFTEGVKINPILGTLLSETPIKIDFGPIFFCYRIVSDAVGRATIRWKDSLDTDKWVDHIPFIAGIPTFFCQPGQLPVYLESGDKLILQTEVATIGIVQGTFYYVG